MNKAVKTQKYTGLFRTQCCICMQLLTPLNDTGFIKIYETKKNRLIYLKLPTDSKKMRSLRGNPVGIPYIYLFSCFQLVSLLVQDVPVMQ